MSNLSRREFIKTSAGAAGIALASSVAYGGSQSDGGNAFDYVIAGAGHNSLITAAFLARAGFSVVVLEGRPTIGGGCKSGDICMPGFTDDWCSSVHNILVVSPLIQNDELGLLEHGLEYIYSDPIMHIPFPDKKSLTMWNDPQRTYEEYAKFSKRDANTFLRLLKEAKAVMIDDQPPSFAWDRRNAMSAYDLVKETFEDDHIRSFHLAVGKFTTEPGGDPGTGSNAYIPILHQLVGGRPIPKGGSGMLTQGLGRVIEGHGGIIHTSMPVEELVIEGGKCVGVRCADGSRFIGSKGVVSTIHIKHLVSMAPKELWGDEFLANVDLFQPEEGMFAYHLATSAPLEFPLEGGGTLSPLEATVLPYPERVLRGSYDDARGIINLEDMWMQIISTSIADPSRTPEGFHTIKVLGNAPYELAGEVGTWDENRDEVKNGVLENLQRYAPSFTKDKVIADLLMSPQDLEKMNPAFWRGSIHAGGSGSGQAGDNRPVPGWAEYRMPIPGLYQTGACTQPGGSITGHPGRNAAKVILADAGRTLEDVVANGR